jgi:Domain of unknown function (DUF4440)
LFGQLDLFSRSHRYRAKVYSDGSPFHLRKITMTMLQRTYKFSPVLALLFLLATITAHGDDATAERTRNEIAAMLTTFLTPAVNNTVAGHERFWADDLVYTSSNGKVMSKSDILKSFPQDAKPKSNKPEEPGPVFTAEDVLVRPYGDTAALTFRLVERDPDGKISYFRNSGTFLLRNGKWQAITWQATRVPAQEKK